MIEFITASHSEEVLNANLNRSHIFSTDDYSLTVLNGFDNVPKAYNSATPEWYYRCYVHNDVFLPTAFIENLLHQLGAICQMNFQFGVIGVAGVKLVNGKRENFGNISDRGKPWAFNLDKLPAEVDTLDELLVITRGDFVFDENLPLDFYAADICMQARAQGRKCYAINAYVEHNSRRPFKGEGLRTLAYYSAKEYFKNKWKQYLPICTSTGIIE